jgi:dienelactone hydrolase
MKTVNKLLLGVVLLIIAGGVSAKIVSETIEYKDGDTTLKGEMYYDDAMDGKRPGVLVVHEWWGLNDYARKRAEMLAEMGYVAFAADMYGDNKVTTHAKDAGAWKNQITSNVEAWQNRANLGLDVLKNHKLTDNDKTAAVGYCFGGATVIQMAYAGSDVNGIVSFHGSLPAASESQAKSIKTDILIAHGNADSFVPAEQVSAFRAALDNAGVNYQFNDYDGARHAFTNPGAGEYGIEALAYNEEADKRSWQAMQEFFAKIFK